MRKAAVIAWQSMSAGISDQRVYLLLIDWWMARLFIRWWTQDAASQRHPGLRLTSPWTPTHRPVCVDDCSTLTHYRCALWTVQVYWISS